MSRRALDIVTDYVMKAWNEGRAELVRELCADPIIRHDPNSRVPLSHDEQEARIRHSYDDLKTVFENVVFYGDDEYVTLVWNVTGSDPNWKLCGIEIFHVENGRITEVWNLPYANGRWSMSRSLSGKVAGSPALGFPILDVETSDDSAKITVPVDARNIGRWLELVIGQADTISAGDGLWRHRFAAGPIPLARFVVSDAGSTAVVIDDAQVDRLSMELVPSAVVNASIDLSGRAISQANDATAVTPAADVVRLAQTFGTFDLPGEPPYPVIDARIIFEGTQGQAKGQVTLRVRSAQDAERSLGAGRLSFGWRQGDFSLHFEAEASLGNAIKSRQADGEVDVSFPWGTENMVATLINDRAS